MESLSYAGGPHDAWLRESGAEEEPLEDDEVPSYEDTYTASVDDDLDPRNPPPPSSSTSAAPPTNFATEASPPPPPPRTANDHFADLLKYSLATSSLLSPRRSDAIPLYPPLVDAVSSSTPPPTTSPPSQLNAKEEKKTPRSNVADWEAGWDTRGQGVLDRDVIANVTALVRGIVWLVGTVKNLATTPAVESVPLVTKEEQRRPPTMHETVLGAVDQLVKSTQELDQRTARALGGIREVECVNWGLGLSDPLPPISRIEAASPSLSHSHRARLPSPLGFSCPLSHSTSSHPLRALALRQTLSTTLTNTTTSLNNARISLNELNLLPSTTSPTTLPSSSLEPGLAELSRHEAQAAQDRLDAERREQEFEELMLAQEQQPPPPSSSVARHNKRYSWSSDAAPLPSSSSATSETSFGGIERRASTNSRTRSTHRVRPSIGSAGVFGVGTLAGGRESPVPPSPVARHKRRPASLGVWPGQSLSFALREAYHVEVGNGGLPSTPVKRGQHETRKEEDADDEDEEGKEGLLRLQEAFEEMHDVRRGLLWKVLTLVDNGELGEKEWEKVVGVLEEVKRVCEEGKKVVKEAVEKEFGSSGLGTEMLGSAALGRSVNGAAAATGTASKRMSGMDFGASTSSRPGSSQSTHRPLSLGSPLLPSSTFPSTSSPRRQPPSHSHSRGPSLQNFAPPSTSSSTPLTTLTSHHAQLSLSLRSIAAKLHLVNDDVRRVDINGGVDVDRLLATHDSIKNDLDTLVREWEDSRLCLRAVARPPPTSSLTRSSSFEDDGVGSTSLDSIPDEESEPEETFGGGQDQDQDRLFRTDDDETEEWRRDADEDDDRARQGRFDSFLPPPGHEQEQVFEATVGSRRTGGDDGGVKLSREERIRAMQEKRKSRVGGGGGSGLGAGGGVGSDNEGSSGGGAVRLEAGMVAELKDVLTLLKGRNHLPPDA